MPITNPARRVLAAGITAIVFTTIVGAAATADDVDVDKASTVVPLDADAALLHDQELSAETHGTSIEAIVTTHASVSDFRDFRRRMRGQYPEGFAGAYLDWSSSVGTPTIIFKGAAPEAAALEANRKGFAVREDGELSHEVLLRAADGLLTHLADRDPDAPHGTAIHEEKHRIRVYTRQPREVVIDVALDVLSEDQSRETLTRESVEQLIDVREEELSLFHGRGGNPLIPNCRTGFSVRSKVTGSTGVLTAGHCDNARNGVGAPNQSEDRDGDTQPFDAPFREEFVGQFGDIQFHTTTGHLDYGQFWANGSSLIYGSGSFMPRSEMVAGENVCSWSVSGVGSRRCVPIESTEFSIVYPPGFTDACPTGCLVEELVLMLYNIVYPGDSGGPWSQGAIVFGTTVGSIGDYDIGGLDHSKSFFSAYSAVSHRYDLLTGVHGE